MKLILKVLLILESHVILMEKKKKTALTKIDNCTDPIEIPKDIFSIPITSIEIYNENKCIQNSKTLMM